MPRLPSFRGTAHRLCTVGDVVIRHESGRFQVRVVAIIRDEDHILVHSFDEGSSWSLPGGRLSLGETFRECIGREMSEELGVEVEVGDIRFVVENFFEVPGSGQAADRVYHEIGVYLDVDVPESIRLQAEFLGTEHLPDGSVFRMLFRWVPTAALLAMPFHPVAVANLLAADTGSAIVEHVR